jgi:hypothetical protein
MENETDVSKTATSLTSANNAATEAACGAPGSPSSSSSLAAGATSVSEPYVLAILESYLATHPPTIGANQMEELIGQAETVAADTVDRARREIELELTKKIDDAKADILAQLLPMVKAIVSTSANAAAPPAVTIVRGTMEALPHSFAVGDPVKVWNDPEGKTFRLGEVVAIHEGGHAFDVKLDDGAVSMVSASGLAFDDRR